MKIKDQWVLDGEKLIHAKSYDVTGTLDAVRQARDMEAHHRGEMRHVGRVPGWLITEWLKEAGVKWDDMQARNELIHRKLQSGDYSAFRNWTGTY